MDHTVECWVAAAFAAGPGGGNPAGVCLSEGPLSAARMQAIAADLAQPETAFIHRQAGGWRLRWFSPIVEVELCGHATVAAAAILWDQGLERGADSILFSNDAVAIAAHRDEAGVIWIDLPLNAGVPQPAAAAVTAAAGRAPIAAARHGRRWLFEYEDEAAVVGLRPDFAALVQANVRSLIVTAPSASGDFDIVSRNFAPEVGVPEDQATGSAHACLAPHWRERLGEALRGRQASRRGGVLQTLIKGDVVAVGGHAFIEQAGRRL